MSQKRFLANRLGAIYGFLAGIVAALVLIPDDGAQFPASIPLVYYIAFMCMPIVSAVVNSTLFKDNYVIPKRLNQHLGLYAFSIAMMLSLATCILLADLFMDIHSLPFAMVFYLTSFTSYIAYKLDTQMGRGSFPD